MKPRFFLIIFLFVGSWFSINTHAQRVRIPEPQSPREISKTDYPELIMPIGHSGYGVNCVAFSPDGKLLASGGDDGTVKLWNVTTGGELRAFTGHSNHVLSLAFSPDGKTLVSGSADKSLFFWDIESGRVQNVITDYPDYITAVAYSADGKLLAFGGSYNTVLWDLATSKILRSFAGHISWITSLAFSRDGQTLVVGGGDDRITFWNIATGQETRTVITHTDAVWSLSASPVANIVASGSADNSVQTWDTTTGVLLRSFVGHTKSVTGLAFSPSGRILASGSEDMTVKFWDVNTGKQLISADKLPSFVKAIAFSPNGSMVAAACRDNSIVVFDSDTGQSLKKLAGHASYVGSLAVARDGKSLATGGNLSTEGLKLWNIDTGRLSFTLLGHSSSITETAFAPDGQVLASGSMDQTVRLWSAASGRLLSNLTGHTSWIMALDFSPDGSQLATGGDDGVIKIWDVITGRELETILPHDSQIHLLAFSCDGKLLAAVSNIDGTFSVWDIAERKKLLTITADSITSVINAITFSPDRSMVAVSSGSVFVNPDTNPNKISLYSLKTGSPVITLPGHATAISSLAFSADGQELAAENYDHTVDFWDVSSGRKLSGDRLQRWNGGHLKGVISAPGRKLMIASGAGNKVVIQVVGTGEAIATLIALDENDWVVTSPDARFDTNKSLDQIHDLQWLLPADPFKTSPLEIFERQYYEPGLLIRLLQCHENGNCDTELKPLPPIAEINRVQPNVSIRQVTTSKLGRDFVDIMLEVESVVSETIIGAAANERSRSLSSGGFDLRLFRDGQLVGVSTPKNKMASYIAAAPKLANQNQASGKLIDTPEDRAWREANDLFTIKSDDIKQIGPNKIEYTFRNIKLPQDGRKEVAFTAYCFNSDRVKSATTEPFKYQVPDAIARSPRKGRAFLISIGVNASENPKYDLRYAANDARKMQEIVGGRLRADLAQYSEVVQVPLISDYGIDKKPTETTARKAIIHGVFSLLAGHPEEVPAAILAQIPNREKLKAVEPEDTLIITYSGHGYTNQSGIFYMVPYDIGTDTTKLTTEGLGKLISSDELSLWMQDITAAEMIMIIDACHSSAAVQGDGFKPGPMGSRGLGQLAYDKDMKILSATQSDNIALETENLEEGLLTYALLQDGVLRSLADADNDKKMLSTEWLSYAEKRVPELYQEVEAGKLKILVDGKVVNAETAAKQLVLEDEVQESSLNLQQPSLFDFKRRKLAAVLFNLSPGP